MKAPIHSTKHYVQVSFSSVTAVSTAIENLIQGVAVANKNVSTEVEEGAIVKAIYIEFWSIASAADNTEIFCIFKAPEDGTMSFAEAIALNSYNNKKNVLFVHQGLSSNDGIGNPHIMFQGWVKIPKGKQRFGLGDKLSVSITNQHASNDLDYCGFATYKEYL